MPHPAFAHVMRRIVTGDSEDRRSTIILDAPPAGESGAPGLGGLYEIWHEALDGPLDARDHSDRGESTPVLSPRRRQSEGALVRDRAAAGGRSG
jgi:hypothetical protein